MSSNEREKLELPEHVREKIAQMSDSQATQAISSGEMSGGIILREVVDENTTNWHLLIRRDDMRRRGHEVGDVDPRRFILDGYEPIAFKTKLGDERLRIPQDPGWEGKEVVWLGDSVQNQ